MAEQSLLAAIPEARRAVAQAALSDVCGRVGLESVAPVAGGASAASIYRVQARGRSWLLRLEALEGPSFPTVGRAYACMRAASDAGVAPRLHYADPRQGVAVMDFISARPLAEFPGGTPALIPALAELIGRVNAIQPAFEPPRAPYPAIGEHLLTVLSRSALFRPGLMAPHLEGFERVRSAYRFEGPAVSCHNDPNRQNVLFDGQRLWLIDWELAFANDPLVDLGILAENFAQAPGSAEALLAAWLGRAPDRAVRARFALARQLSRAFYAGVLLSGFAASPPAEPDNLTAPSVAEFTQAVAEGRLTPASPGVIYTLGKMLLAGFLENLSSPEVRDAFALAGGG